MTTATHIKIPSVVKETNFKFPRCTNFYRGKVRDVYTIDDKYLLIVVTDRISAFDIVLPRAIPYKGQVLNQIASYFLDAVKDIVSVHMISSPDPNAVIGWKCEPYPVEMVVRAYLSGHAWREYKSGKRELCGVKMPDGMKENAQFPEPIITPSTKAQIGHDEDISEREIIKSGLVDAGEYEQLKKYTLTLFKRGTEMARRQGLILVDTKYEFGNLDGKIFLIDEIHTPDSSRYFYADVYEENQKAGRPQKQLSKEFVREWLMANGFQGKDGQKMPEMDDEFTLSVSERYIELFEKITGNKFMRTESNGKAGQDVLTRIEKNVTNALAGLK